jgi:putative ABC transport system permease protein
MRDWKTEIRRRLSGLDLAPTREAEIVEELSQHLRDRYEELRAGGATDREATRAAWLELDDGDLLSRQLADVERRIAPEPIALGSGGRPMIAAVWQDVRYAARTLRKNPGFTAVVVLTLALGIGATAAIFSVVNAVMLRPLPYEQAHQLVVIWGSLRRPGLEEIVVSAAEYVDFQEKSRSFSTIAAYDTVGVNLTGVAEPERLQGAVTTASFFRLLGVSPVVGRTFLTADEQPGHEQVVVLGHALWQRRFQSDPAMVGRSIALDGKTFAVVGVMPAGFRFPDDTTEVWKPLAFNADDLSENNRGSHTYTMLARLKSGVTLANAQSEANTIADRIVREHPSNYRTGFGATVRPLQEDLVGAAGRSLFILLGAVGFVLLIACANVANLLLARSAGRRKEVAIRIALGASRARVIGQLLTESVLLSLCGGAVGLLTAVWGVSVLVALGPASIPRLNEITLDERVILFTSVVSLVTGVLFGLAPALQASRTFLGDSLKEGGRSPAETAARGRVRGALIVSEVALSLVLLIAAGLLINSFARLHEVTPGFNPDNVLTMRVALPPSTYTTFQKGEAFFDRLFARVRVQPGVQAVAAINAVPFSGRGGDRSFFIEGRPIGPRDAAPDEQVRFVSAGYFSAMQTRLVAGREFTERDRLTSPRVAVVNEALARKYWPDEQALGKRVAFNQTSNRWYEIVGVVGDVRYRALDVTEKPQLYVPILQPFFDDARMPGMDVVIRTASDALALVPAVRHEILAIDPDQPIAEVRTMEQRISESLSSRRFNMLLLGSFAALALVLAGIGIYGLVAYSVTQRTHEIGVRVALGAQNRDVLTLLVGEGMTLALLGVGVGLAAALALTRVMSGLLFGVSPTDPATFGTITVVLARVALAASYVPARRAARVNPVTALRNE